MYLIEKTDYGFKLTLGGFMKVDELREWSRQLEKLLEPIRLPFGVMVDMRTLKPLPDDAHAVIVAIQGRYRKAGMDRSVVILRNATTMLQFKRLARESGIYEWERYLNAAATPDFEAIARKWLLLGIDPHL